MTTRDKVLRHLQFCLSDVITLHQKCMMQFPGLDCGSRRIEQIQINLEEAISALRLMKCKDK